MKTIPLDRQEKAERIAIDTKKQFAYDKHQGLWFWYHKEDEADIANWSCGFQTRKQALMDAVEPYLGNEE